MICDRRDVEEGVEDFEGALADCEAWLHVLLWWYFWCYDRSVGIWRVCCAFGLALALGVWLGPSEVRFGFAKI